jgi:hypothetical protein
MPLIFCPCVSSLSRQVHLVRRAGRTSWEVRTCQEATDARYFGGSFSTLADLLSPRLALLSRASSFERHRDCHDSVAAASEVGRMLPASGTSAPPGAIGRLAEWGLRLRAMRVQESGFGVLSARALQAATPSQASVAAFDREACTSRHWSPTCLMQHRGDRDVPRDRQFCGC